MKSNSSTKNPLDILQELHIEWSTTHHHARDGWIQIKECPFCHSTNYHLGWNTQRRYVNCYRCGSHDLFKTLQMLSRAPTAKITKALQGYTKQKIRKEEEDYDRPLKLIRPVGVQPLRKPHRSYLIKRGFDPDDLVQKWDIQGIGIHGGPLAWRIYIPIIIDGVEVSWTTRSIGQSPRRYHMCLDKQALMPRNEILYGIDYVRHVAVIVEGPTDVWAIGPGAVCSMGLEISRHQILKLASVPIRVICFDPEPAAQMRAKKLATDLAPFKGDTYQVELSTGDPGEATKQEIAELKQEFGLM